MKKIDLGSLKHLSSQNLTGGPKNLLSSELFRFLESCDIIEPDLSRIIQE